MRARINLAVLGASFLLASWVTEARAVPSLGVGSSDGYINATGKDPYQTYWGKPVTGSNNEDGFIVGLSGSKLHVWSNITKANIYILTTSDVYKNNNITFNGKINEFDNTGTFRSYGPTPYFGIDLGQVTSAWTALNNPPFTPGPFYSLDVKVDYTGKLTMDNWIFAAADNNGLAGLQANATSVWTNTNGLAGIQDKETTVWSESNGLDGIQNTATTKWFDDNGLAGIQTTDTIVWVDDNGVKGFQQDAIHKNKKIIKADTWKEYEEDTCKVFAADTSTTYEADTFTKYQGEDSSPKTTSARGFGLTPQPVPEPSTMLLLGAGLLGFAAYGRKRIKK